MSIWFCNMKVKCPKFWGDLKQTDNELVRDCDQCGKPVHFINSQEQLEEAALEGNCVAFYDSDTFSADVKKQFNRIRDLNTPSTSSRNRMTLGLPSSAKNILSLSKENSTSDITNISTSKEVEIEFKAMLNRIGGGFKFVGWIEKNKQGGLSINRSELAMSTSADRATALYASDYTKKSHIVAHACQVNIDGSFRASGEINYYEDQSFDIEDLLASSLGTVVASYSEPIVEQHELSSRINMYGILVLMLKSFDKHIADF